MTTILKKYIAPIVFLGYTFLALFSLIGFSSHVHGNTPMSNCPYAFNEHSLCTMDAFAHIEGWKSLMQTVLSYSVVALAVFAVIFQWAKSIEIRLSAQFLRRPIRQYSPLTILFSRGILNPKIP